MPDTAAGTLDVASLRGGPGGAPVTLKLVVVEGPDEGLEAPLVGSAEIGSDPSCTLVLTDRSVSRHHARVSVDDGNVVVKDLKSRNGTFVGEMRVHQAEITLGAVLRIGKSHVAVQPRWQTREVSPSTARAFGELLGESVSMREIFAILERVARSDVTLLVEGESGTGKELVARSLHAASPRAKGPYVVFDCASVPSELAESELFGHKKGAFSGATADRLGAFQRAHGGTLCLDELGELPLDLQPKLLRVLESRELRAVGDDTPRKVDVRVVASTNRDLHAEVRRGRFRADLLYRLEVVRVRMPPLRNRPEDIPGIVARLLEGQLAPGDEIKGPNLDRLLAYAWPGNVRELRNALMRAVALQTQPDGSRPPFNRLIFNLGPAENTPATLGHEFPGVAQHMPYKEAKGLLLESFDRVYFAALLDRFPNNVLRAAEAAGLSRRHLYEMLKRTQGFEPGGGDSAKDEGDDEDPA
jgi:DNA-binding NtrC family response regulator